MLDSIRYPARAAAMLLAAAAFAPMTIPSPNLPPAHPHPHEAKFAAVGDIAKIQPIAARAGTTGGRAAAGGPAIPHREGGRVAKGRVAGAVPHAFVHYTDTLASEPTLGVNRKGHLFFVGLDNASGVPQFPVLRSNDGGRSWENVSPRLGDSHRHPTSQDPMLYVDKDTGRVFTADFAGPCTPVSFTDDEGASWTTGAACGLADHQNLFTGPPALSAPVAYPNVVYYCAIDAGAFQETSGATGCLKSLDGGVTFVRTGSPPFMNGVNMDPGNYGIPGHCSGVTGHGFVDEEGTVYLPRGWCGQPWLAISHDEGATWTRVQVANNGMPSQAGTVQDYDPASAAGYQEHEAGVVVDRSGNIYYVWTGQNRLPYLAISRDGGESWSKPMMIGPPGLTEASLPAIDIGPTGRIAISYIGSTNAPGGEAPDGEGPEYTLARWNGYVTVTDTALARDPLFFTATVNTPKDPLVIGNCGILRCQQMYDFIDVVVDRRGEVWTSMVDGCFRTSCVPLGSGMVGLITTRRR